MAFENVPSEGIVTDGVDYSILGLADVWKNTSSGDYFQVGAVVTSYNSTLIPNISINHCET